MNPFDLSTSDLLIWGIVLHLIADWPLQNDWMANNKMKRANLGRVPGDGIMTAPSRTHPYNLWFVRHPAAYVHSGIHGVLISMVFGWVAIPLAIVHLLIDTRYPVIWWSKLIRQIQPGNRLTPKHSVPLVDLGMEVRFWTDQVFHIICIATAAILVTM